MLKFDASIFGGELPVGLGVVGIAVVLPGGDFVDEDLFVGNAAIEPMPTCSMPRIQMRIFRRSDGMPQDGSNTAITSDGRMCGSCARAGASSNVGPKAVRFAR